MTHQQTGARRRAALEAVRHADAPLGAAEVAGRIGVHPNTARFHLETLADDGTLDRIGERPSGPGRPRTVYAVHEGMDRGGVRGYRLLAEILTSYLAGSAPDPAGAATEAGRAWGRYLVDAPPPFRPMTADDSIDRLVGLLDNLGFEPETAPGDTVRLRHCPFLELAETHRQVVCPVHLGLMQGALAELASPVAVTGLRPFAEANACLADLAPAGANPSTRSGEAGHQ